MISIIVPVYNARSTLERCVDSIINLQNENWELILIDDGSTDGSSQLCEDYASNDVRIKVIHKKNGGVSSARNVGLDVSLGEWVCFIDSDDYVSKNYLSIDTDKLDVDVFFLGSASVTSESIIVQHKNLQYDFDMSMTVFFSVNFGNLVMKVPWAKCIRRSFIGKTRFPEDLRLGEDLYFNLSLINANPKICVDFNSTYYYQLPSIPPDKGKYLMSPRDAAYHCRRIYQAYKSINKKILAVEIHLLSCFFNCCDKNNHDCLIKYWYNDNIVIELEENVRSDFYPFYYRIRKYFGNYISLALITIEKFSRRCFYYLQRRIKMCFRLT